MFRNSFLCLALAALLPGRVLAGTTVLKWGDTQGPTHIAVQMIDRIAKDVSEKSGGALVIQSYPGGQLGGSIQMIEGVQLGSQDIVTEGAANVGQFLPAIGVMESPYVWRGAEHLEKVMSGPIGEEYNQKLISTAGMRILGTTYYGARQLTTTSREVRGIKDMAELKVRVPENEVFLAMADSWGAKPTPMNFNELYLALKQNVVDAQENPLPTIDAAKFYEVQKYLVKTFHIVTPRLCLINEDTFRKLGDANQRILLAGVAEGIRWNNREILRKEAELEAVFKNQGMTIVEVDIDEFRRPVLERVVPKFEGKWGKGAWERILSVN
ncbi:MAG: sialic acid TRAP transporter substrate-binding protein SiaP [Planctomycetota bacterium]|jgi:tripartite ATP-independent transporter DctP family solute receptor|nr:sialic acid TRAP transporter substrate-binding protein SiaP [Planctomycetota bacterium]